MHIRDSSVWRLEASTGTPLRQETLGRAARESRLFEGGCTSDQIDDLTIGREDALEGSEHHRVTKKDGIGLEEYGSFGFIPALTINVDIASWIH